MSEGGGNNKGSPIEYLPEAAAVAAVVATAVASPIAIPLAAAAAALNAAKLLGKIGGKKHHADFSAASQALLRGPGRRHSGTRVGNNRHNNFTCG